jgi:hypothetical protein
LDRWLRFFASSPAPQRPSAAAMDASSSSAAAATSVQVAVRVRRLTPQEEAEGARGVVLVQDECGRVEVGHGASAKAFTCVSLAASGRAGGRAGGCGRRGRRCRHCRLCHLVPALVCARARTRVAWRLPLTGPYPAPPPHPRPAATTTPSGRPPPRRRSTGAPWRRCWPRRSTASM